MEVDAPTPPEPTRGMGLSNAYLITSLSGLSRDQRREATQMSIDRQMHKQKYSIYSVEWYSAITNDMLINALPGTTLKHYAQRKKPGTNKL